MDTYKKQTHHATVVSLCFWPHVIKLPASSRWDGSGYRGTCLWGWCYCSTPRNHMVERKTWPLQIVFWLPHALCGTDLSLHTHTLNFFLKKLKCTKKLKVLFIVLYSHLRNWTLLTLSKAVVMLGMIIYETVEILADNPRTIIASDAVTSCILCPEIYNRKNIH